MIDWLNPLLSLLGGAIGAAVTGAALSHFFQRRRFFQEQLIQRYSELVGVATTDIDRAKRIAAAFVTGDPLGNEALKNWVAEYIQERDHLRGELSRLCFQIRLLEPDPALGKLLQELERAWPFLLPGKFGSGNFNERFEKFEKEIVEFRKLLESIMERVQKKTQLWKV